MKVSKLDESVLEVYSTGGGDLGGVSGRFQGFKRFEGFMGLSKNCSQKLVSSNSCWSTEKRELAFVGRSMTVDRDAHDIPFASAEPCQHIAALVSLEFVCHRTLFAKNKFRKHWSVVFFVCDGQGESHPRPMQHRKPALRADHTPCPPK